MSSLQRKWADDKILYNLVGEIIRAKSSANRRLIAHVARCEHRGKFAVSSPEREEAQLEPTRSLRKSFGSFRPLGD